MRDNYPKMQDWIGLSEGGYVNHKDDPGGATDRGITQRTFDAWNRSRGKPKQPVKGIPKAVSEAIIEKNYFDKAGCDDLPSGLDYAVGDYAVNSGVSRAVKDLQRELGVTVDGIAGVQTAAASWDSDVDDLIRRLCERRMRFLKSLHHWPTFGDGWEKRVMGRKWGAQTNDIGVIDRGVKMANGATNVPAPVVIGSGKGDGSPNTLAAILRTISGGK